LVEAIHQGRSAVGVEYEPRWAGLTRANCHHAKARGATGHAEVVTGDARRLLGLVPQRIIGRVALVVTSPPYGSWTHGHVRTSRDSGQPGVHKRNHRYSRDPANLAHRNLDTLLDGFVQIMDGCRQLLAPRGTVAVTVRPIRIHGELVDLPGRVSRAGEQAGLRLIDRIACLLCGLRGARAISRASFFQLHEVRKARLRGLPLHAIAHEDLIVFTYRDQTASKTPSTVSGSAGATPTPAGGHDGTSLIVRSALPVQLDAPGGAERRYTPSWTGPHNANGTAPAIECRTAPDPVQDAPGIHPVPASTVTSSKRRSS
jgi:hypothetical protein